MDISCHQEKRWKLLDPKEKWLKFMKNMDLQEIYSKLMDPPKKRYESSKNRCNVNWSTCNELKNKKHYKIERTLMDQPEKHEIHGSSINIAKVNGCRWEMLKIWIVTGENSDCTRESLKIWIIRKKDGKIWFHAERVKTRLARKRIIDLGSSRERLNIKDYQD